MIKKFKQLPGVRWLREINRRRLMARKSGRHGLVAAGSSVFWTASGRSVVAPATWAWGVPDSLYLSKLAHKFSGEMIAAHSGVIDPRSIRVGRRDDQPPVMSIVIAAYGQTQYTLRCLQSLAEHPPSCTHEVIVVEDASGVHDADVVGDVEGVIFISNDENLGYLRSCNKAVAQASGEYVCLLNNDTELTFGALDGLLDLMRRDPSAGIVGAKLLYPNGCLQEAGGVLWSNGSALNYGRFDDPGRYIYEYVREVDYVSGAAMLMKRGVWNELGGYDELYCPAYCEDSDLAIRVRSKGLKVMFQPRSIVIHHEGVSHGTSENSGLKSYQRVNREKLSARWSDVLAREQLPHERGVFRARDRAVHAKITLVIDHYVPEPDRDAGSRTMMQMIDSLISMGHRVKFWPDNLHYKAEYVRPLQDKGVEVIYGNDVPVFSSWIKACGHDVDYVLLSRPTVAVNYIQMIRKFSGARLVYYGHDLHFARMAQQAQVLREKGAAHQSEEMKSLERTVWRTVDVALYPSLDEVDAVKALEPSVDVRVICPYAFPRAFAAPGFKQRTGLLFVAGFQHSPNVDAALWLAREIMPLLIREMPGLHLTLAGSNPTDQVKALAGENVTVTGSISDEQLSNLYGCAQVALIPLRFGAGIKLKVVEAMHKGLPLVTTSVGVQGLVGAEGVVQVADNAEDFAKAVMTLLKDEQVWQMRSQLQSEYAVRYFSPEAMARGLQSAFGVIQQAAVQVG